MWSIILGSYYCRHSHNENWNPIAERVHELLLEFACTGVVGHLEIPNGEEEVQPFKEHPGEGGQVEVVQHPCDDGTQHLEGRQELGMWSVPDHSSALNISWMLTYIFNSNTCVILPGGNTFLGSSQCPFLTPHMERARNTKEWMPWEPSSDPWQTRVGRWIFHGPFPLGGCDA